MVCRALFSAALVVALPQIAGADSIYLANGRVIRTAEARIVDDRVVFVQYGARQALPTDQVVRVERDDHVGPSRARRSGRSTAPKHAPAPPVVARLELPERPVTMPQPAATGGVDLASLLDRAPAGVLDLVSQLKGVPSGGPDFTFLLEGPPTGALDLASLLGGAPGGVGGLDSSVEIGQLARLLPLLGQLGDLLAAENPTPAAAKATLSSLLAGLQGMGVSEEMIRARAAEPSPSSRRRTAPGSRTRATSSTTARPPTPRPR